MVVSKIMLTFALSIKGTDNQPAIDKNNLFINSKKQNVMITIKPNTYQQPIEVREFVVQGIIDAFLAHVGDSTFHPYNGSNYCRSATHYLRKHKNADKYYGFSSTPTTSMKQFDDFVQIHGCEMKEAFRILIENGYYIFKIYEYNSWMGYIVNEKPYETFYKGACKVTEFNDFID